MNQYWYDKNCELIGKHKQPLIPFLKPYTDIISVELSQIHDNESAIATLDLEYAKYNKLIDRCTTAAVFCADKIMLDTLLKRYPHYRQMYSFFPSVDYFLTMLATYNMADIIKTPAFMPIFAGSDMDMEKSIMANCEKTDVMHNGIRIFAYQPFDLLSLDTITKILTTFKRLGNIMHVNLNTSITWGEQIFKNDMRSLDKQVKYRTTAALKGLAQGKPVICVGAAPSLKKHLPLLKKIQKNFYIIAVMAALKPLRAAGIEPDLCTVIDMDDIILKYFDQDLTGVKIAIEQATFWGVMEEHPEADYYVSQSSAKGKHYLHYLHAALETTIPPDSQVQGAMTVQMMSVQLAKVMGASDIIILGTDLAYEVGESHISGNQLNSSIQIRQDQRGNQYFFFDQYGSAHNVVLPIKKALSWDGKGQVNTTFQFQTYREYIEYFIRATGWKIINAGEAGVYIKGCEHIPLKDAVKRYTKEKKQPMVPVVGHKIVSQEQVGKIQMLLNRIIEVNNIAKTGADAMLAHNWDGSNRLLNTLQVDKAEIMNFIAQNNLAGYFLYKYIGIANQKDVINLNKRNMARLMFTSTISTTQLFIDELNRVLARLEQLGTNYIAPCIQAGSEPLPSILPSI